MKTLVFWGVLIAVALLMFGIVRSSGPRMQNVTYTQFLRDLEAGNVVSAKIRGGTSATVVHVSIKGGTTVRTVLPANYREQLSAMQSKGVNVEIEQGTSGDWPSMLLNASPFLILLLFWIIMMRYMQTRAPVGQA
jgi:cell division protease FtsH